MKKENIKRFSRKPIDRFLLSASILFFVHLIVVAGCSPPKEKGTGFEKTRNAFINEHERIYAFSGDRLVRTTGFDELPDVDIKPWTRQIRAVEAHLVEEELYCAVNGLGIIVSEGLFSSGIEPSYELLTIPGVFTERTVGAFFPYRNTLYCHLYYDSMFRSAEPTSPAVALVSLDPADKTPRIIPFSFQDRNEGWELVFLSPGVNGTWFLAWKFSSDEKREFKYTELDTFNWGEEEVTEGEFLTRLTPSDGEAAPGPVSILAASAVTAVDERGPAEVPLVLDIVVRSKAPVPPQTFRFGSSSLLAEGACRYEKLNCFQHEGVFYLLLPWGEIFLEGEEGLNKQLSLPPLPEGFVYTGFLTDGNKIVAFWEYQEFTMVGNAGILVKFFGDGTP